MFMMSNYAEAIELLQSDFKLDSNFLPSGLYLAACHALVGNVNEAKVTVANVLQVRPGYQLGSEILTQFKHPEDRKRFVDGLRQAGLC
jgi:hypothetical protein